MWMHSDNGPYVGPIGFKIRITSDPCTVRLPPKTEIFFYLHSMRETGFLLNEALWHVKIPMPISGVIFSLVNIRMLGNTLSVIKVSFCV